MSNEIEMILSVVCPVFNVVKLPVVITSGLDGPHRADSLHSCFRAIDIRKIFPDKLHHATWKIHSQYILDSLRDMFRAKGYPVIVENEVDHIHIEWRVKS